VKFQGLPAGSAGWVRGAGGGSVRYLTIWWPARAESADRHRPDHLDAGSVASPNRRPSDDGQKRRDRRLADSDALLNTAAGATLGFGASWRRVGIGYSIHAGWWCATDEGDGRENHPGSDTDPGRRHAPRDAGMIWPFRLRRRWGSDPDDEVEIFTAEIAENAEKNRFRILKKRNWYPGKPTFYMIVI